MANGAVAFAVEGGTTSAEDAQLGMVEAQKEELLRQFLDLLGDDPSLDGADRAQIQQELSNALDAVGRSGEVFEAPDRAVWMDAAKVLHAAGAVADDEANALIRQLDGALSAFERKESKFAMEFSSRMLRDGEAAALEWLRQNRQVLLGEVTGTAAQSAMSNGIGRDPLVLGTDVIQSKARRVRGPPSRGGR